MEKHESTATSTPSAPRQTDADALRAQVARLTVELGAAKIRINKYERVVAASTDALKARAAAAPANAPALTVWYGSMPESNGRHNYTAVLHRKDAEGFDIFTDGFQFARSEHPDRVRYEADFMCWLIGERSERPEIWDDCYDFDKHSGYVKPAAAAPAGEAQHSVASPP